MTLATFRSQAWAWAPNARQAVLHARNRTMSDAQDGRYNSDRAGAEGLAGRVALPTSPLRAALDNNTEGAAQQAAESSNWGFTTMQQHVFAACKPG